LEGRDFGSKTKRHYSETRIVFFSKGNAAFILMEGRGSMDATLDSVRMQNSGYSGDAILGSSRLTHGSQLVDADAALAQ